MNSEPTPAAMPSASALDGTFVSTEPHQDRSQSASFAKESALQQAGEASESHRFRCLAVTLQILSELDSCDTVHAATDRLCRLLHDETAAAQTTLLWRPKDGDPFQVVAEYGKHSIGSDREKKRYYLAAAEEVASAGQIVAWPDNRPLAVPSLTLQQLAKQLRFDSVTGVAIRQSDEEASAVVVSGQPKHPDTKPLLRMIATTSCSRLNSIHRNEASQLEKTIRGVRTLARSHRRNLMIGIATAVAFVMLIPVRYRIAANVELQPVQRRFVSVPFDGLLSKVHIRAGDVVEKGELLATLDPREIEFELAAVQAEQHRVIQQEKSLLAARDIAGSQIAALEAKQFQSRSDLLGYRLKQLEIRSPAAGLVVECDAEDAVGKPVSRGDDLAIVAPLERWIVRLAIDEADIAHIASGMEVNFHLHAYSGRNLHGQITRILPQPQQIDHQNVFLAEFPIDDPESLLRPGMRGRGRIIGRRHPLVWNLFHKPWNRFWRWLGV